MITDPVAQHVVSTWLRGYRVTRGSGIFTQCDLLHLGAGADRGEEYDRNGHESRGLRLSLSLSPTLGRGAP